MIIILSNSGATLMELDTGIRYNILLFCLQVSLCDDYSLPVDFVNKRRPVSAATATSTVQWALPSPTVESVSTNCVDACPMKCKLREILSIGTFNGDFNGYSGA